jgi:hypothetical protein
MKRIPEQMSPKRYKASLRLLAIIFFVVLESAVIIEILKYIS